MEGNLKSKKIATRFISLILIAAILCPYLVYNTAKADVRRGKYDYLLYDGHFTADFSNILYEKAKFTAATGVKIWAECFYGDGSEAKYEALERTDTQGACGRITIDEDVNLKIYTKRKCNVRVRPRLTAGIYGCNTADFVTEADGESVLEASRVFNFSNLDNSGYLNFWNNSFEATYYLTISDVSDVDKNLEFEVRVIRNKVLVAQNEVNVMSDTTTGKVYVKTGAKICFDTEFGRQGIGTNRSVGTYAIDNHNGIEYFSNNENRSLEIRTSHKTGETMTIDWKNAFVNTQAIPITVTTSNAVNTYTGGISGDTTTGTSVNNIPTMEIWESTGSVSLARTIYVPKNKQSKVTLTFRPCSTVSPSYEDVDLQLEDKTNCLNSIKATYVGNGKYELLINPKADYGLVTASWKDYRNKTIKENWKIVRLSYSELAQKQDTQNDQEITDGNALTDSTTDNIDSINRAQVTGDVYESTDYLQRESDNSNGGSNYNSVPPQIEMNMTKYGSEKLVVDVKTSGAERAMFQIKKRKGETYDTLSELERPSMVYEYNGGISATDVPNGSVGSYSFTISPDLCEGEGYYDAIAIAVNESGVVNWLAIGPNAVFKQPKIDCTGTKENDSEATIDFYTDYATDAKFYVVPRMVNEDGSLADFTEPSSDYSDISGLPCTIKDNHFRVKVSANQLGRGYYDVVGVVRNRFDNLTNYVALGPMYFNVAPRTFINSTKIKTASQKEYEIICNDEDISTCNCYYYISKKASKSAYVKPSNETIINYGTSVDKIRSGSTQSVKEGIITLSADNEQQGTGYYDITVLAIDSDGACSTSYVSNIPISNAPTVTYSIEGENGNSDEGYVVPHTQRNVHKLTVNVKDEDMDNAVLDEQVSALYFVTTENLDENDIFQSKEKFTLASRFLHQEVECDSQNNNFEITIEPDDNTESEKYVYMMVEDKYGGASYYKIGAFKVDDTELELQAIDIIQPESDEYVEDKKISYVAGDEMRVMFQFNHTMKEMAPDLYLQFGSGERKQDRIEYDDNKVVYVYEIKNEDESGAIQLSRLDYTGNKRFEDNYSKSNRYEKNFASAAQYNDRMGDGSNVLDCIENNKYFVDASIPTIQSIVIDLTTDENVARLDDNENNKIYLSNIVGGNLTMRYSETVKGTPLNINLLLGNNYVCGIASEGNEGERAEDIYSLDNVANIDNAYEGPIEIEKISDVITVTDIAGNKLNNKDYTVSYKINGVDIAANKQVIIDKYVESTKITNKVFDDGNTTNINARSSVQSDDCFNVDTKIDIFSEYASGNTQDYKDESGIDKINIQIYNKQDNGSRVIRLTDKDGGVLLKTRETGDFLYPYVTEFDLTENQLPLTLTLENEGMYKIAAIKEDKLGNKKVTIRDITVSNSVTLDSEKSGYKSLDKDTLYNLNELTDENLEYELYVKNESEVASDKLSVWFLGSNGREIEADFSRSETIESEKYAVFTATIDYGGIYKVSIYDDETNTQLLTKDLVIDNIYVPCDTNNDGYIDAVDVSILLKYLVHTLNNRYLSRSGDVNNNNSVDVGDGVILCRYVAKDTKIRRNNDGYLEIID